MMTERNGTDGFELVGSHDQKEIERRAVRAAHDVLAEAGYTRDTNEPDIDPDTRMQATAAILRHADSGWRWEFIVEAGIRYGEAKLFDALCKSLCAPDEDTMADRLLAIQICDNANTYATPWIEQAIALLPSNMELVRDRATDEHEVETNE